ncbi:MAG: sulfatase [Candidatus Binatia bacterium]|nr:sulfatase [Candidatus Binatia bacterium]
MQFVVTRKPLLALVATLLACSASCRSSNDVALQPVVRLTQQLEGGAPSGAPARCAVADESRPALGCPTRRNVLSSTLPFPEGTTLDVQARLPAELSRGRVVLEPSLMSNDVEGWKSTPPIVLEGHHPGVTLTLPIPENLERTEQIRVRIVGQAIPDESPNFRTKEIAIGPGSTLHVGLAIDSVAADVGAAPTVFQIVANGDFGSREVLRSVVHPEETRERWIDRRVDISALSGQDVRFELRTEVQPAEAGVAVGDWSVPIWGNPQILQSRGRNGQRNVILVSLDTMRGDFVGRDYEGQPLTPELDARAREGASFQQALAPYPSTSASHMSLFTSSYPAEHKVLHAKHVLPAKMPTLAEIFAANSYATAAFTENAMLAAEAGFERGFDDYYENRGLSMWDARGDIEQTLDRGLRWLGHHRGEKFFLFLHSYQVHTPYEPPPEHDVFHAKPLPGEKPRWARMRNRYAGEVVYTDRILRRLFDTLDRLGLSNETIVVVTADHGDEFGEHGSVGHSRTVYDEVLRVPLVFWAPGLIPAGAVVDGQVSLVDLGPTLLDLVRIPPVEALGGESLAPALLHGEPPRNAVRFAEGPSLKHADGRLFSARTEDYKWIGRENLEDPVEIYDLRSDPGEQNNLAEDPELRAQGRELLGVYRAMDAAEPGTAQEREVDTRTQDKLRALGYLD